MKRQIEECLEAHKDEMVLVFFDDKNADLYEANRKADEEESEVIYRAGKKVTASCNDTPENG